MKLANLKLIFGNIDIKRKIKRVIKYNFLRNLR